MKIGIVKPYESHDGRVNWTVQELDSDGEPLFIIAECTSKAKAQHLIDWIKGLGLKSAGLNLKKGKRG